MVVPRKSNNIPFGLTVKQTLLDAQDEALKSKPWLTSCSSSLVNVNLTLFERKQKVQWKLMLTLLEREIELTLGSEDWGVTVRVCC